VNFFWPRIKDNPIPKPKAGLIEGTSIVFALNRRINFSVQNSGYSLPSVALVFWNISTNILGSTLLDEIKLQSNAGKHNSVRIFAMFHHTSTGKFLKAGR
jgi:hypothetical protein